MNLLLPSRVLRWASARLNVAAAADTSLPTLWPVVGLTRPVHCQCGMVTAQPTPCRCGTRVQAACRKHYSGHRMPYEVGVGRFPNGDWLDGFENAEQAVDCALRLARGHYGPEQFCRGWVL